MFARSSTTTERLRALVASMDAACAARRWSETTSLLEELSAALPPRLGKMARSVMDFVAEGDHELASQMWEHLKDAIDGEKLFAVVRA